MEFIEKIFATIKSPMKSVQVEYMFLFLLFARESFDFVFDVKWWEAQGYLRIGGNQKLDTYVYFKEKHYTIKGEFHIIFHIKLLF